MSTPISHEEPSAPTEAASSLATTATAATAATAAATATSAMTATAAIEHGSTTVQYTTVPALFDYIARNTKEIITVNGVSPREFMRFLRQSEKVEEQFDNRRFRVWLYTADTERLVLKMIIESHEGLHKFLDGSLLLVASSMGLLREFFPINSGIFIQKDSDGKIISAGEGDSCRKPRSLRPKPHHYPTLVIEAGWTQSLPELQEKAHMWFAASRGDVKVVILAKAFPRLDKIMIEKWTMIEKEEEATATQEAPMTATTIKIPQCVRRIEIYRPTNIYDGHPDQFDAWSYHVERGTLEIEFEYVFLQRATRFSRKQLELNDAILREFAADFWQNAYRID